MKRLILITAALLTMLSLEAQTIVDGVAVKGLEMERNGEYLVVDMEVDLSALDVDGNRAVLLTPRLVGENDSIDLPSIGIYGRKRYYFYVRNGESMLTGADEKSYKASQKPDNVVYHHILPYQKWMNTSVLSMYRSDYGCCNTLLAEQDGMLGRYTETEAFFPELVYVQPKAETEKHRSLEGSAFIDFPVNKTVIYPDYRRNAAELGKIQATIDSVQNDKDITITSVLLKGYASPESPYAHNEELAKERTAALKKHIQQLYKFDAKVITTEYEPEDWAGLRCYVEQSNMNHRKEILAIIDCSLEPDAKEWRLKRNYPDEYRFLLQNCYPALRHTDYRISYNVRSYNNAEEIKRVMQAKPQNLSLNEFYLVAEKLEPGTEDFAEVFETAVRMYPNDKTANLNAANAAMRRNDLVGAARYLAKAGNSPEAEYARGVYAYLTEDYDKAGQYFKSAKAQGITQADAVLERLKQSK